MEPLKQAYHRLRYRSELENELEDIFVGKEFHLPVFEIEEEQLVRQNPDYEELIFDLYGNPDPVDLNVEHEKLSYQIDEIKFRESYGVLYKVKRLLGRTDFKCWLEIKLNFGEEQLSYLDFSKHPLYEDLEAQLNYYNHHSELTINHEYQNRECFGEMLFTFNRILATCWSIPDTIPEAREGIQKWEIYNRFKKQAR